MLDDPLSDILRVADVRAIASGACTVGGAWALRFPAPHRTKFFAIARGGGWLRFDGDAAMRLEAGDVFLISARTPTFVLATDLTAIAVDAASVLQVSFGATTQLGSGDDCTVVGGVIQLDAVSGGLLGDALPKVIHVRRDSPQAAPVRWLLEQLVHENGAQLIGAGIVSTQLAQLMLVQILRAYVATAPVLASGWLRAIGDTRIASALRAIHREPKRAWRLDELAKAAAMSRTTFAVRFKEVAGVTPLAYVTQWRMRLAEKALREATTPVAELAWSLGYASESAFSTAFKRFTGKAPRHYRNAITSGAPSDATPR